MLSFLLSFLLTYTNNNTYNFLNYNKQVKLTIQERKSILKQNKNINKIIGFKDNLFNYKGEVYKDKDNIVWVNYNMRRDLEDRDVIDVEKVDPKYVKLLDKKHEEIKKFNSKYGNIEYIQIKNDKINDNKIKQIYIFFHGKGNPRIINKYLGVNDWKFGGNFNRIKNLVLLNNSVYISVDIPDFYNKGPLIISEFIKYLDKKYKNGKIILVGASSGGEILWNIFKKLKGKYIDGVVIMGSIPYKGSIWDIIKWGKAIYITHGTKDKNINYNNLIKFYKNILTKNKKFKIKLVIFKNGVHGTPIRMTDWKGVLTFFN